MRIAQIQSKLDRLMEAHKALTRTEFIAHSKDEIDASDLEWRYSERLAEIASTEQKLADKLANQHSHDQIKAQKARRTRWHGFTFAAMRFFPYYEGLDLTKAQKAVLCALMASGGGNKTFAVAHDWICAKAGVSRGSVKNTLRRLKAEGLIHIRERRIRGKAMNLWNEYTVNCAQLLKWAKSLFTIKGSKNKPHPLKGDNLVSTQEIGPSTSSPDKPYTSSCRQVASRISKFEDTPEMDFETFSLVTRGVLAELNDPLPDIITQAGILDQVEALKTLRQPDYNPFLWDKAVQRHGLRRCLLAFLETQLVKKIRLTPIPDRRAWNERETIKDANRYLYGILARSREECRPEMSLGAILLAKQVYELPPALTRAVRAHNQLKAKLAKNRGSDGVLAA